MQRNGEMCIKRMVGGVIKDRSEQERQWPSESEEEGKKGKERKTNLLSACLLLAILERSAVAGATSGTHDWYLEQRSSGIAAEDLMFCTHLGSTNTSCVSPLSLSQWYCPFVQSTKPPGDSSNLLLSPCAYSSRAPSNDTYTVVDIYSVLPFNLPISGASFFLLLVLEIGMRYRQISMRSL